MARAPRQPAAELPVARVCVDLPLPHLDRPFDYLVPASEDASAQPGVRVRVRFAGQRVDGWLLERVAESDHPGRLAYLERVVSPERVLHPEVLAAARAIAARYAGSLADVLRLAVPPRHARVEAEPPPAPPPAAPPPPAPPPTAPIPPAPIMELGTPPEPDQVPKSMIDGGGWAAYPAGAAWLRALGES